MTYAEINLETARQNLALVKRRVGENVTVIAVVKADAYSHGAVELAHAFLKGGAGFLAVANVEEAIKLRSSRINSPIIILNPLLPEEVEKILKYELTPIVDNINIPELLNETAQKCAKKVKVHVEVDTGMGRGGFFPGEVVSKLSEIKQLKNIVIEGIFTHFPSADDDRDFTAGQIAEFKRVLLKLEQTGINIPYKHTANSAGLLGHPESFFNMIRPGLCLYGILPSPSVKRTIAVKAVLTLKSMIIRKREVPAGQTLSYGRTYTTSRRACIGTLPVGYSCGYDRRLSNKADVLVRGKRCPVVGTISMDRCLVDLADIPEAKVGDEVVLIGRAACPRESGEQESISVEELAEKGTIIPHEFISRLRVSRTYTGNL